MKVTEITRKVRQLLPMRHCGAVIVAAGTASRMGGVDKIMAPLGEIPVILRTIQAFAQCEAIGEIVVVTSPERIVPIMELCAPYKKVTAVVAGGKTRQESVWLGMNALQNKNGLVAIQDGARPLVTWQVIDRTVRAANAFGAAAPGVPVKDTVKRINGGIVAETPDRSNLRAIQTPQVFLFDMLRGALKKAEKEGVQVTDDCAAVERLGMSVKIVEGDERNIKITTPLDLKIAELLLEEME